MSFRLAIFGWLALSLSLFGNHSGAFLASHSQEEETSGQSEAKGPETYPLWEEKTQDCEQVVFYSQEAPYLERSGVSAVGAERRDVEVYELLPIQPASSSILSQMQVPLDRDIMGSEGEEESKQEQSRQESGEAKGSQRYQSGCGGRETGCAPGLVHRERSLGANDPASQSSQAFASICGRDRYPTESSFATATSCTHGGQRRDDRREHQSSEVTPRPTSSWDRTVGCAVGEDADADEQEQGDGNNQVPFPWSHSQAEQSQGATHNCERQDCEAGYRMGPICARDYDESCQPCSPLSSVQTGARSYVSPEDARAGNCEARNETGIRSSPWEPGGISSIAAKATGPGTGCSTVASNARCHSSRRPDHRAASSRGRRDGGGVDCGDRYQARRWGQESSGFPWSHISDQSGQSTPETKKWRSIGPLFPDIFEDVHFPWMPVVETDVNTSFECQECKQADELQSYEETLDSLDCHAVTQACDDRSRVVVANCEASFADDLWKELEASTDDVHKHLNVTWLWSIHGKLESTKVTCPSRKRVTFSPDVEIHLFQDDLAEAFIIGDDDPHAILRRCWNSTGGSSPIAQIRAVLSDEQHRHEDGRTHLSIHGSTECSVDRIDHLDQDDPLESSFDAMWITLNPILQARRNLGTVEVWYLRTVDHEVCISSRTVRVLPGSEREFRRHCIDAWVDVAVEEPFEWHLVREHPQNTFSTRAHVVLVQRGEPNSQYHLIHWDAWPILRKFRALIVADGSNVETVLSKARNDGNALRHGRQYGMRFHDGGFVHHLDEDDVVNVPSAAVLYGYVQHVPESGSNITSSVSTHDTTATQISESDDEDVDYVSWMTGMVASRQSASRKRFVWECKDWENRLSDDVSPVPTCNSPMHNPNQVIQPLSEPDLDQVFPDTISCCPHHALQPIVFPEQGDLFDAVVEHAEPVQDWVEEEIFVMHTQWHDLVQVFDAVRQEAGDTPFRVITFGLGLVDLGRRDVRVRGESIQTMLTAIADAWNDHAQFAPLQVILVNPQPQLDEMGPYVVFIVEVMYMEAQDPQRRKPVLTHQSGVPWMIGEKPTFAVWLEQRTTKHAVLEASQRIMDVYPNTIRDVHVSLRGTTLPFGHTRDVADGDLGHLVHLPVPQRIFDSERLIMRARDMFLDVRTADNIQTLDQVRCCIHGISPQNRPLGSRELVLPIHLFSATELRSQASQLWPFEGSHARIVYVRRDDIASAHELDRNFLFHWIVDYQADHERKPILLRRCIYAVTHPHIRKIGQ